MYNPGTTGLYIHDSNLAGPPCCRGPKSRGTTGAPPPCPSRSGRTAPPPHAGPRQWYLYKMVAQSMLRTYKIGNLRKKSGFDDSFDV